MIEVINDKNFLKEWILEYQTQVRTFHDSVNYRNETRVTRLLCQKFLFYFSRARKGASRWGRTYNYTKMSWLGSLFAVLVLQTHDWSFRAFRIEVWKQILLFAIFLMSNFIQRQWVCFHLSNVRQENNQTISRLCLRYRRLEWRFERCWDIRVMSIRKYRPRPNKSKNMCWRYFCCFV